MDDNEGPSTLEDYLLNKMTQGFAQYQVECKMVFDYVPCKHLANHRAGPKLRLVVDNTKPTISG